MAAHAVAQLQTVPSSRYIRRLIHTFLCNAPLVGTGGAAGGNMGYCHGKNLLRDESKTALHIDFPPIEKFQELRLLIPAAADGKRDFNRLIYCS